LARQIFDGETPGQSLETLRFKAVGPEVTPASLRVTDFSGDNKRWVVFRYLSCFSGIGGLEASHAPESFCEIDSDAASILKNNNPSVPVWDDIRTFQPPKVEVVAGGWPCQDLSIAGKQEGLKGLRSGLLMELIRVARESGAHTIVAENVTNLLRLNGGLEFQASLQEFQSNGFSTIAWRVLNTRSFGLPQHRSRLLIIASRNPSAAYTIFRKIKTDRPVIVGDSGDIAAGFYWTAGTHSINYTRGYVPTIKIGSSIGIASPPAVHYGEIVRTISAGEALALQGFDLKEMDFPSRMSAYRAAGNAVARDIGRWVLDGLLESEALGRPESPLQGAFFADDDFVRSPFPEAGIHEGGKTSPVRVESGPRACNLSDFLDLASTERLSLRASSGLIRRLDRSGQPCPEELRVALESAAGVLLR
jgi:DNA (cytosine-5)-methyltransferase 1